MQMTNASSNKKKMENEKLKSDLVQCFENKTEESYVPFLHQKNPYK